MENNLEQLKEENQRLRSLLQITQTLGRLLDLESLLRRITEIVCHVLKADRCTVFLLDTDTNELWSKIATGLENEIRFPVTKGIAGSVATSGEILNIPDAYADPRFNPEIDKNTGYKTRNMLTMPLRNNQKEIIGVFQILNKLDGSFTQSDEELVEAISSIAANSIENAKLYEEMEKSFVSFIETLSITLDARDYITFGHSKRVTLYAVQIAQLMRLSKKEVDLIRYASLLHDIGKLGVPEPVLFKSTKLSEKEYELIKGHASLSQNILSKIHFQKHLKQIPDIASSHHEKIDGTGYPKRLKEDEIPLGGKILAVCDVFDAMTSRRQYRDRMHIEKVMKLIEKETGTAFDPFIVYQFKNIALDVLIQIIEYGNHYDIILDDLNILKKYTLNDIVSIRLKKKKTEDEKKLNSIFQKYYQKKFDHEDKTLEQYSFRET